MTLTEEKSSNKAEYEALPTAEVVRRIREAMSMGCIRPCHVYDLVDEALDRLTKEGSAMNTTPTISPMPDDARPPMIDSIPNGLQQFIADRSLRCMETFALHNSYVRPIEINYFTSRWKPSQKKLRLKKRRVNNRKRR